MKKIFFVLLIIIFIKNNAFARVISGDAVIKKDIKEGIKIVESCTLTFLNNRNIQIGNIKNSCPGIELALGVKLKIDIASKFNVKIYGGYYVEDNNEYDCAGIYVPPSSSLIIESQDDGKLIVYPFDRSAGIGGNGVLIENNEKLKNNCDAGEIIINKGTVVIQNVLESSNYGLGAKIGGGGICNIDDNTQILCGGNLDKFHIEGGRLIIMGNCQQDKNGMGAMIGGGGIANFNNEIESIRGGNLVEADIQGGSIEIKDYSEIPGVGAKIGGGGIYNCGKACSIKKGRVFLVNEYDTVDINDNENVYGNGSIYNNGDKIENGVQIKDIITNYKTLKNYLVEKFVDVAMLISGVFMIFELVT